MQNDDKYKLPADVNDSVRFLLGRLKDDLGDNLSSLTVVGSSLTCDYNTSFSDINTVMVVNKRSFDILKIIAGYGKDMGKRKLRAPLLMTPEYISQSRDVFGLELMDFQLIHNTVYGEDPFADMTFLKQDIRLQCERQLKAALISLRQGYISALGKPALITGLLTKCVSEMTFILRGMLFLKDIDRPIGVIDTLSAAAGEYDFDQNKILPVIKIKQQQARCNKDQVESLFEDLYQLIDSLSRVVDGIEV